MNVKKAIAKIREASKCLEDASELLGDHPMADAVYDNSEHVFDMIAEIEESEKEEDED